MFGCQYPPEFHTAFTRASFARHARQRREMAAARRLLAEEQDDTALGLLVSDLTSQYENDNNSRKDWRENYEKGLELLGYKYEERTEPFRGASGVTHPILAEAATQFQAQAYNELLPPSGPVRTVVMGAVDKKKEQQAHRVKEFMNYYLMNEMQEYTPEFDQMLYVYTSGQRLLGFKLGNHAPAKLVFASES